VSENKTIYTFESNNKDKYFDVEIGKSYYVKWEKKDNLRILNIRELNTMDEETAN